MTYLYYTFLCYLPVKKKQRTKIICSYIFLYLTHTETKRRCLTQLSSTSAPLLHLPSCWSALMLCLTGRGQVASSLCQLLCYMLSTHLFHTHKCFWKCSLVVEYRFNWGSGKTLSSKIFSKVIFTEAVVVGDLCWAVDSDCITYVLQQGPYF